MPAIIKYCANCADKGIKHEFQDKQYGQNKRVHSICDKDKSVKCSVCSNKQK